MDKTEKPKLLIVDDEPEMLDFIERVLRRKYNVTRCNFSENAPGILTSGDFELLVTDQKMPKLTGVELLEEISALYPEMVRVLLTGFTEGPDVQRAVDLGGIHNYILKPVDSAQLMAGIEKAYRVRDGEAFHGAEQTKK